MRRRLTKRRCSQRGLTLAEIVISTAIVGIMTVAALESLNMVYRTRRMNSNRLSAHGLAQEVLAEALAKPYDDLTLGDTTRDGSALAGYEDWQMQVAIVWARLNNPKNDATSDRGVKRITVTITDAQGKQTTLVALRSRGGSLEQPQGVTVNAVTSLSAALRTGNGVRAERWGAALTNPAADAP